MIKINVVQCSIFVYQGFLIKLNFIFETLDDKKNNQKIDQKHKRRFQVSQFLSENSNCLIVGTSVKFWSKI